MDKKLVDNLVSKGAEILYNNNTDLPQKLLQQDADLDSKTCVSSRLGDWVDIYELSELRDLLDSPDAYYRNFTCLEEDLTAEQRITLLEDIETHIPVCARCQTKVNNDAEFENLLAAEGGGSSESFLQMVGASLPKETEPTELEEETESERIEIDEVFEQHLRLEQRVVAF